MNTTDFAVIDALFSELGHGVSSEDGDIGFTVETIADVKAARQNYSDIGRMTEGTVDGHNYVEFRDVRVAKGQPRKDVVAIEIGDKLAIMSI